MTTTMGHGRKSNFLKILTAAAFLAAVLFASNAPAHAKDHGHRNQGRKAHGAQVVHRPVPQVLAMEQEGWAKPYYSGRVYYAPHHHYHARYSFPVYYGGGVTYRPYSYCGDHLFVTGAVTLPQLAIGFNFGSPGGLSVSGYYGGAYPGGYYPGGYYPVPPPAPVTYYVWDERYRCRHDCGHDHDDWDD